MDVNPVDLVAIGLVVLAALFGYRSGALPQVGGLLGAIVGGVLAILALPWFEDPLRDVDPTLRPLVVLTGLPARRRSGRDDRFRRRAAARPCRSGRAC